MTRLVDPSVANLDEVSDVLFEVLYSTLGSFEEAIAAANEVATLIPEGSTDWELRITFHADAYETEELIPADIALSAKEGGVALRQMLQTDLWYSQRGWTIGRHVCTDALLGDGFTAVIRTV